MIRRRLAGRAARNLADPALEGQGSIVDGDDKVALKQLALGIVRAQTNVYVKELLREHNVRIGATKEDFDTNLMKAIDDGVLTREHLVSWLDEVEGWGQQHVYVYRLSTELQDAFSSAAKARKAVTEAQLGDYWGQSTTDQFEWPEDEDLHLVSITYEDSLRFHWHKGTRYWVRTKEEQQYDKPTEWIDGFEYQFRAFRGRSVREVMRFEIRPQDQVAALFIPRPINSPAHQAALVEAKRTLRAVLDVDKLDKNRLLVGKVIRNFDQALTFNAATEASPQTTRLRSGGAYVEFGATIKDGSYFDSPDVRIVREVIRTEREVGAFDGTSATFRFGDLGRVELSADDSRIKLWSSLTAERAWGILRTLKRFESGIPSTVKRAGPE